MEKLFFSRLMFIFFLASLSTQAQEFIVYKTEGSPTNTIDSSTKTLKKGALVKSGTIELLKDNKVLFVDQEGRLYELNDTGKYNVPEIKSYPKPFDEDTFSKKYFTYVWKQLKGAENTKQHTGNVYRDNLLDILIEPKDSIRIFSNEITFSWNEKKPNEYYYFFLRNNTTNTLSKIGVYGNSITLFVDDVLLTKGNSFAWGVSQKEFPNFTQIKFNAFKYLTAADYEREKNEITKLTENLLQLGLTQKQIDQELCDFYNLCH
ncbi:hypothetical protein [Marixanthomonas spongiae]|uniref:GLPGLI family protein n=1 Tax=Marixanthomonas spongiae TaxID=2174845 RepID=A0A2U0I099_9FLAO|nr:hypothetical protein [Marixanthomonas spongiae]PVW14533.1 hypothetical protein DDV96_08355 [Marixanthomonas spongiae]